MSPVHTLVFNPSSGNGKGTEVAGAVRRLYAERGVELHAITTTSLEHATSLAEDAGRAGSIVLACGGDGLIGAVARGCANVDAPMAVIPAGRGNDFARAVGLPTDTSEAVDVAFGGHERPVDLGVGNGLTFCCIASCGFDSDANRIANELPGSALDYAKAALIALRHWKDAEFTVVLDGRERTFKGYSVIVANTAAYGGGMMVAPDADPTDGLFDVVCIGKSSKLSFLLRFPLVFAGKHVRSRVVSVERARRVEIRADRDFTVYADGDPLCPLPATIESRPAAVRLLVPA